MKGPTLNSDVNSAASAGKAFTWFGSIRLVLWTLPAIALAVGLLLTVTERPRLSDAWINFLATIIYSVFIGLPSSVLLHWAGFRFTGRYPRLIFAINAAILLFTATAGTLAGTLVFIAAGIMPLSRYWNEFRGSYPIALIVTLVSGIAIASYETLRHQLQSATLELRTRQVEQERANKFLAEARLSSLESRIHPHFLFNTLNSIAALIPRDPRRAEDTVGKLASLLRFSLNAHHHGLVPLSQEIKVVHDYLDIESTRFGERLRYKIDVPEPVLRTETPPLALQSLVENAVKHVVAQRPDGATIAVSASRNNGLVRLEVTDDGPGFSPSIISPEHGLGNLIARLDLLFGDRGKVDVERRGNRTVVSLEYPAE